MMPSLFQPGATRALEEAIAFSERRHSILAGNIANMDTPGYQARDLSVEDFQSSLKQLLAAQRNPPPPLSPGDPNYGAIAGGGSSALASEQAWTEVRDAQSQIVYHDGSNDNLETQITEIAKNQTQHATAIALLKSQYRALQMAISGNVGV